MMAMEPNESGRAQGEGGSEPSQDDAEWSELLETARAKSEADDTPANVRDTMLERDDDLPGGQPPLPQSAVVDALADEIMPALERRPPGGARKVWAIVGIVVLIAGFAASAWYALRSEAPMMAAKPPVFKADPAPVKVKPAEPGGLKVPNQDKLVYERLAEKKPAAKTVKLAPPPEKPVMKPKPTAPAKSEPAKTETVKATPKTPPPVKRAAVKTAAVAPAKAEVKATAKKTVAEKPKMERLTAAVPKVEKAPKAPEPAKAVSKPAPKPAPAAPAKAEKTAPEPPKVTKTAASAPAAPVAKPAAKTESTAKTPPPPTPVKTAAKATATAKPASANIYRVQLLSARNAAGAKAEYLRLKKKYASLLGDQPMDLQTARIKGKGTYYRIRVGSFDSAKAARGFCAKLTKAGQGCLLARP